MWLVAGVDAAASSLLSSLQWSCLPSPYAPRRREDGEHDGANEGAWRSSSASAAGVVCLRTPVLCRSLQMFVAAVGKWLTQGRRKKSNPCGIRMWIQKKKSCIHLLIVRLLIGPSMGKPMESSIPSLLPSRLSSSFSIPAFIRYSITAASQPHGLHFESTVFFPHNARGNQHTTAPNV